ncbi:FAD-dependent oxidoreductase [Prauserella oleivorans]
MDADAHLPPPQSLWIDTAPAPQRAQPRLPDDADIVVIGAGIAGLTTAYLLAREGGPSSCSTARRSRPASPGTRRRSSAHSTR